MNYYEILEISPNASEEVIKTAFRTLAKKYHPDTSTFEKQYSESMMKDLNMAFNTISDPVKRKEYDISIKIDLNKSKPENHTSKSNPTNNMYKTNAKDTNIQNDNSIRTIQEGKGCFGCLFKLIKFCIIASILLTIFALIVDHFTNDSAPTSSMNTSNTVQKSKETPEIINYDAEMKKYAIRTTEYLNLYIGKHNIILNSFPDKDKLKPKLDQLKKELESNNSPIKYLELENHFFNESIYKLTSSQTNIIYLGELKDNKPNGLGLIAHIINTYATLDDKGKDIFLIKYFGYFENGLFDGFGNSFYIPNEGEIFDLSSQYEETGLNYLDYINSRLNFLEYEGEFENGKETGLGNYFEYAPLNRSTDENTNTSIYIKTGTFKDKVLDGIGKEYMSDGYLLYDGSYKDGLHDGEGTLYFTDSSKIKYKGNFSDDNYDGKGTLYDETGKVVYSGEWNRGDYK